MHQLFSISDWNNYEFPALSVGSHGDERVRTLASQTLATRTFYRLAFVCRSCSLTKKCDIYHNELIQQHAVLLSDVSRSASMFVGGRGTTRW
jgi:hypothetical protein